MKKKQAIFITLLFCLYIGGMLLITILLPKQDFSQMENRYLQEFPKLSGDDLFSGKYMEHMEDYISDHIVGRDLWVEMKAGAELLSGKKENNDVYLCGDTLINRIAEPEEKKLQKDVSYLNALVDNVEVPVYFGLIPSAASIWSDKLPSGAPTADEAAWIEKIYGMTTAHTVDLYSTMADHASEYIYYRTDHHWTSLGAAYCANTLLEAIGEEPLVLSGLEKTTVSQAFYGTIYSSSGAHWVPPDTIDTYIPDVGVDVTCTFNGEAEPGSLYVEEALQKKDKYSFFLGGNQPLCVIKTQVEGGKLLIIRDSYSDSLAPFLTRRFSEIHLLDPRYNRTSIQTYVQENDIDTVLVLYSFSDFITDQNLFQLSK